MLGYKIDYKLMEGGKVSERVDDKGREFKDFTKDVVINDEVFKVTITKKTNNKAEMSSDSVISLRKIIENFMLQELEVKMAEHKARMTDEKVHTFVRGKAMKALESVINRATKTTKKNLIKDMKKELHTIS